MASATSLSRRLASQRSKYGPSMGQYRAADEQVDDQNSHHDGPGPYKNIGTIIFSKSTNGTVGTVFTSPILSGYLTRINETRIVKLR